MKKALLIISFALLPLLSLAQLPPNVKVELDATAQRAINSNNKSVDLVKGYRVCIFSDNSQNARSNAQKILNQYNEMSMDIEATMEYDNPFFRVYTGYCINRNEAVRLLGKLKPSFPLSIISQFNFELNKLTQNSDNSSSFEDNIEM
ncbi:MAG: SPOR domain-containing protein [Rikenellaceae bacterium]